jgi:hypothetical protein
MGAVLRSLFWKEWHEQRWKVLFGSVLIAGCAVVGLKTRILPDEAILVSYAVGAAFLLPILAAMDLVAAERADGSLSTLISMPVRPWMVLAVKMVVASLACIVPQAAGMVAAILMAGGRELRTSHFVGAFAGCTGVSLCLLMWTVGFSVRQPSEARAALVGLAVIVLWSGAGLAGEIVLRLPGEWFAMVITPFGFLAASFDRARESLTLTIIAQVLAAAGLFAWAASRLGRPGRTRA